MTVQQRQNDQRSTERKLTRQWEQIRKKVRERLLPSGLREVTGRSMVCAAIAGTVGFVSGFLIGRKYAERGRRRSGAVAGDAELSGGREDEAVEAGQSDWRESGDRAEHGDGSSLAGIVVAPALRALLRGLARRMQAD